MRGIRYNIRMFDWSAITNSVVSFALGVAGTLLGLWLKRERIKIHSDYSGGQLYITVFNPTNHPVNLDRFHFHVRHKGTYQWVEIDPSKLTENEPNLQIPPRDRIKVLLGCYACISHGMAEQSRFIVTLASGKKYIHTCKKGCGTLSSN